MKGLASGGWARQLAFLPAAAPSVAGMTIGDAGPLYGAPDNRATSAPSSRPITLHTIPERAFATAGSRPRHVLMTKVRGSRLVGHLRRRSNRSRHRVLVRVLLIALAPVQLES